MKSALWTPNRNLHLPTPALLGLFLELGAWDKYGKLFHQERIQSRSPVKAFLQIILSQIGAQNITMTDTGGAAKTIDYDHAASCMDAKAILHNDDNGIVIGESSTAVDILNNKLITQIIDGTGAGLMIYNAMVIDTGVTVLDPDCTFILYRNFNNNSGSAITVRETGIYAMAYGTVVASYFCIVRDVPTAIAVPDGGGCYVKYTLKITE